MLVSAAKRPVFVKFGFSLSFNSSLSLSGSVVDFSSDSWGVLEKACCWDGRGAFDLLDGRGDELREGEMEE